MFGWYIGLEASLLPLFALVSPSNLRAAYRLVVYTSLGGLPLLRRGCYLSREAGSSQRLALTTLSLSSVETWRVGLCLALGIRAKIPRIPLHCWLPEAHREASTGGSILLSGIVLKLGIYGWARWVRPWSEGWQERRTTRGLLGATYRARVSLRITDRKALIAYTSILHMNAGLARLATGTLQGWFGAIRGGVSHRIGRGGLFFLTGVLTTRSATRQMLALRGCGSSIPLWRCRWWILWLSHRGIPPFRGFPSEWLCFRGLAQSSSRAAFRWRGLTLASRMVCLRGLLWRWASQRNQFSRVDLTRREATLRRGFVFRRVALGLRPTMVLRVLSTTRGI